MTRAAISIPAALLRSSIRVYQLAISPLLISSCRFDPNCSEYARQAIARFGAVTGLRLTLTRLLRCHPWGGAGFDPIPEQVSDPPRRCRHG
jgi:putative membrane protein insertion efficiency factor